MVSLKDLHITNIPECVILPDSDCKKLYGITPTVITRDDMTSTEAWLKLVVKHDAYLEITDFKDKDLYDKYWLLSLGLLEHPVQFIGGDRGGGKSVYMAWFTHKTAKLFGKRSTLDWPAPNPEYYRPYNAKIRIEQIKVLLSQTLRSNEYRQLLDELEILKKVDLSQSAYFSMSDEDYITKINDEMNRISVQHKQTGKPPTQEELEKLVVYNTNYGLDEADAFDRGNRTNYTRFVAMLARRARHLYCGLSLVMVDTKRFDILFQGLCTHEVSCIKEGHLPGYCSILVEDVRKNGTGVKKWLLLKPADLLHLWDSHYVPQMLHNLDISFGKIMKKKKVEEES